MECPLMEYFKPIPLVALHYITLQYITFDAARRRCSPTLLALRYICIIQSPSLATALVGHPVLKKGSDRPTLLL